MSIDFGEHRNDEEPGIPDSIVQRLHRYANRFRDLYMNIALRENSKKHGQIAISTEVPRSTTFSGEISAMRAGFESTRDYCYRSHDPHQEALLSIKECEDIWKLLLQIRSAQPL